MELAKKQATQVNIWEATAKGVPFVDLSRSLAPIRNELDSAISKVIDESSFTLSEEVTLFEQEFAAYCGTKFGIGVSSGTDALHLALRAMGVGPGDEVITVPNTFIATAEAISMCGAKPVFVDIDDYTYNMDADQLRKVITANTKAVIPVHLYGQPTDMDEINAICREYGIKVIEDACQAHGAEYKGKKAGSLADAACFSFYPSKNLGAFGDGGMVVTNNEELAENILQLRNHGQTGKNKHSKIGYCSRLDGLQAAALRIKLKELDSWNEQRIAAANHYEDSLKGSTAKTPVNAENSKHIYHLYVIRVQDRDELQARLARHGIDTGTHYPIPIHLQLAYAHLSYGIGSFPIAEKAANEILSLPMFPGITRAEIDEVARVIKRD